MAKVAEKVFVLPVEGRLCRDPITMKPLNPEGEQKPRDGYWLRRIRCGDCTKTKAKAAQPKPVPVEMPAPKPETKTKKGDDK